MAHRHLWGVAMIDTVKSFTGGAWKAGGALPDGWRVRESVVVESDDGKRKEVAQRFLTHEETGFRIWGDDRAPLFCECSLPRLVFPHNGFLISEESHLQAARARLYGLASQVVEDFNPYRLTRLDTVWQFRGNPAAWVSALGAARLPFVRKEPRIFFGESVEFVGSRLVLRVYDKGLEHDGRRGADVVRLEYQAKSKLLHDKHSAALHWGLTSLESLTVRHAYPWYRGTVTSFPAFKAPPSGLSISGFLGVLRSEGVKLYGRPAEEVYLLGRSLRQQARLRKAIAAAERSAVVTVDLEELLPPDRLPPVVNLVQQ